MRSWSDKEDTIPSESNFRKKVRSLCYVSIDVKEYFIK